MAPHEKLQQIADYVRGDGIAVVSMDEHKLRELERLGVNNCHQILPISAKAVGGNRFKAHDLQQRINDVAQNNNWWLYDANDTRVMAWPPSDDYYLDLRNPDYRGWLVAEIDKFLEEFPYTHLLLEVMPVNVWMGQFKDAPMSGNFKASWDWDADILFNQIMEATPYHRVIVGGDTQAPAPERCDALLIEDFGNRSTHEDAFNDLQKCSRTRHPEDCIVKMFRNNWPTDVWAAMSRYYAAMTMVCSDATFCIDTDKADARNPIRIDADAWDTGPSGMGPNDDWGPAIGRTFQNGRIIVDTQNQDVRWNEYPTEPPPPVDDYVAKINTLGPFMMEYFTAKDWADCTDIVQQMAHTMTMEQIREVMGAVK